MTPKAWGVAASEHTRKAFTLTLGARHIRQSGWDIPERYVAKCAMIPHFQPRPQKRSLALVSLEEPMDSILISKMPITSKRQIPQIIQELRVCSD